MTATKLKSFNVELFAFPSVSKYTLNDISLSFQIRTFIDTDF